MMAKIKTTKILGAILCGTLLILGLNTITNQLNLNISKKIAINKHQIKKSIKGEIKTAKSQSELSYLETQPEDSDRFGSSLAVSDKYLAVGDPGANQVVIYLRQADNSWLRSYEIHQPKPLIGKPNDSDFGINLELKNNILIINSIINKTYWGIGNDIDKRFVKRKTYSVLLSDKRTQSIRKIGSTPPHYYSEEPEFLGDNIALDVLDGKSSHGEGDVGGSNRYIHLINPRTGKKIKEIKLFNFGDNRGHLGRLTIGGLPPKINSDDKNLTVSPSRRGGLQLEPLRFVTKDGNLREIEFPIQYLDFLSNRKNPPLLYPNTIKKVAITNKLLAITVDVLISDLSFTTITTFWQRYPQPKLIDALDWGRIARIDGKENNILISYYGSQSSRHSPPDYRFLTFSLDNKTFTQSNIKWSCFPQIVHSNYPLGLIDGDNLILGAYGTVVTIPIKNLTDSQTLLNPKC